MIPGIARRIMKAESDLAIKDYENALIQALIAIDGTARKRYPTLGNKARMEKLLASDFGPNIASNVKIRGGYISVPYNGREIKIEELLYVFLRCSLLHEGEAPPHLEFIEPAGGLVLKTGENGLQMSHGVIQILIDIVKAAPENVGTF